LKEADPQTVSSDSVSWPGEFTVNGSPAPMLS